MPKQSLYNLRIDTDDYILMAGITYPVARVRGHGIGNARVYIKGRPGSAATARVAGLAPECSDMTPPGKRMTCSIALYDEDGSLGRRFDGLPGAETHSTAGETILRLYFTEGQFQLSEVCPSILSDNPLPEISIPEIPSTRTMEWVNKDGKRNTAEFTTFPDLSLPEKRKQRGEKRLRSLGNFLKTLLGWF